MRRIKCWISQQTIHCFLNRTIFTQLMIFHAGCIVRIIVCKSICIQHICRMSHIVKMPRCFLIISRTFHLTIQSRFFKNRSISVFIGNLQFLTRCIFLSRFGYFADTGYPKIICVLVIYTIAIRIGHTEQFMRTIISKLTLTSIRISNGCQIPLRIISISDLSPFGILNSR